MRRLLLIEDDDLVRDATGTILDLAGYEVATADNGAAALELLGAAGPFQGQPPDAIVLDVVMPEVDGAAFVRAYREMPGPHAPVLVFTARPDAAKHAAELAADGVLPKPFDVDELLAAVARYAGPPGRDASGRPGGAAPEGAPAAGRT